MSRINYESITCYCRSKTPCCKVPICWYRLGKRDTWMKVGELIRAERGRAVVGEVRGTQGTGNSNTTQYEFCTEDFCEQDFMPKVGDRFYDADNKLQKWHAVEGFDLDCCDAVINLNACPSCDPREEGDDVEP